jgi:hypothetical protein
MILPFGSHPRSRVIRWGFPPRASNGIAAVVVLALVAMAGSVSMAVFSSSRFVSEIRAIVSDFLKEGYGYRA